MKNITTKAQSSVGKLSHQDCGLLGFCFFPACSSSAWCRGPARPSSTFSCCSNTPRRSARVNAANVFWYPDHSKNTVNTNQIKRRSFKRASNNSDAYKRLKNLSPGLWELCAYVTLAARRNCPCFEMPSGAGFGDTTLACSEAPGKALALPWYPSFPPSSHRLCMSVGVSRLPSLGNRLKPTWNQSCRHLHKPGPWPQSCALFRRSYSCENCRVGNPSSKLPSVAAHGRRPGATPQANCWSGLLAFCLVAPCPSSPPFSPGWAAHPSRLCPVGRPLLEARWPTGTFKQQRQMAKRRSQGHPGVYRQNTFMKG